MAAGNDAIAPVIINGSAGPSYLDLDLSPTTWPLWVEVGAPLVSVLLFVLVNGFLLYTHKAPPDVNEGVPLSGMADTEGGIGARKPSKGATYGSTENKKTEDSLCVADNMAMTISMEETSLSKAILSQPTPGSSNSGAPYYSENTAITYNACAGACTSKSTEPLVHHAVNISENGNDVTVHKNGGKKTKSSLK